MASPRQLLANRLNAQKSTGPKTEEGKAVSRRNAVKHGLAGSGVVLPECEAEALEARQADWSDRLRPADAAEAWLVELIAVETLRLTRCHEREFVLIEQDRQRASTCWEADRLAQIEQFGDRLSQQPGPVSALLRQSTAGRAWLRRRWEGLRDALADRGTLNWTQRRLALDLLGTPPQLRGNPSPFDPDAEPAPALAVIDRELQALEHSDALAEVEAQERDDAERGHPRQPSSSLARLHRYESSCLRRLQWALHELRAGPRPVPEALIFEMDDPEPQPEPEPKPEPPTPVPISTPQPPTPIPQPRSLTSWLSSSSAPSPSRRARRAAEKRARARPS